MGKRLKVTQTGSTIARPKGQATTLRGLGLGKRHKTVMLEDTPSIRGMIRKVTHLLTVEEVE